jgi:hypothetical protein
MELTTPDTGTGAALTQACANEAAAVHSGAWVWRLTGYVSEMPSSTASV